MNTAYGYTKTLTDISFDDAVEKVTSELSKEGFGVLTEIDVKATLKKKLDVDVPNYRILGACNPPLAHQALEAEPAIGLLLPCNVIVRQGDDDTVTVAAIKPRKMLELETNPEVAKVAEDADARLQRVLENL